MLKKEFFDETLIRTNLSDFGNIEKIYLFLVALDFTTINSYLDYEQGTLLGSEIDKFLKKNKSYIKTIKLGSKFLYIFSKEVTSEMEKELNTLINETWEQKKNQKLKQKIVFFVQKEFDLRIFLINKNNNRIISLFNTCLDIEKELNEIKGYVQNIIKSDKEVTTKIQKKYSIINLIYDIKENKDITEHKIDLFKNNIRNMYNKSKTSYLLRETFVRINKIIDNYDHPDNINFKKEILNILFNYVLWIKTQEILLEIYKIEKIKAFFNIKSKSNEDKIKFEDLNHIKNWYNAVIRSNYPYLSNNDKKLANEINELIIRIINNNNLNEITSLIEKVNNFSVSFNPKGVFNVPLLRIEPNSETKTFFSRQYNYKFKENAKEKYKELRNLFKDKFPFVTDNLEYFYTLFNYINRTNISNEESENKKVSNDKSKNENVSYFVMIFMELDGFNAFNKYMFGNDSDKIYSMIINTFFEVLNNMFYKYDFARNCVFNIMGDEFFFASLTKIKGQGVGTFVKKVTKRIESITKNVPFIKTNKVKIKIKNMGDNSIDIVLREPMLSENKHMITRVGVSTGMHLGKIARLNNLEKDISFEYFKKAYDDCNKIVNKIKEEKYKEKNKERELASVR